MKDINLTRFHREKSSYQRDRDTKNSITLPIRLKKKPRKIAFLLKYLRFAAINKPPNTKNQTTVSTLNSTNIKLEMLTFIPARNSWFRASLKRKKSLKESIRSTTIKGINKTMSLTREIQLMIQSWKEEGISQGKKMPKETKAIPFRPRDRIWWRSSRTLSTEIHTCKNPQWKHKKLSLKHKNKNSLPTLSNTLHSNVSQKCNHPNPSHNSEDNQAK